MAQDTTGDVEAVVSIEEVGTSKTTTNAANFAKQTSGTDSISAGITISSKSNVSIKSSPFGKVMKWFVRKTTTLPVKFSDHSGLLSTINVQFGRRVNTSDYPTVSPYRDDTYYYTFSKWDKTELDNPITAAVDATAVYTKVNLIKITWKVDGQSDVVTKVAPGEIPVYPNGVPTKADTDTYVYTFSSWDKNIAAATTDTTYTAVFTGYSKTTYVNVIFKNHDGTILSSKSYLTGTVPTAPETNPTKDPTASKEYTFSGWSPAIHAVTYGADNVYIAQFTESTRKYNITWNNYNGSAIKVDKVAYGSVPVYNGNTPEHPDEEDGRYVFNFNGWTPSLAAVTGDTSYTAQFTKVDIFVQVRWLNYDNTVLDSAYVAKNSNVAYGGVTPTRSQTASKVYTFSGWSPTVTKVTANTDFVAQYTETTRQYTVTWKNLDGTVLKTAKVDYGNAIPAYTGTTPSAGDQYRFTGWSTTSTVGAGDTVIGDTIITAQYVRVYTYTFMNDNVVVSTAKYAVGETIVVPTDTSMTRTGGGKFKSWNTTVPTTATASDMTFTATWQYKYTFISEGTTVSTGYVDEGATPTPPTVTNGDNIFVAWSPSVVALTKDMTFTAQWEEFADGQVVFDKSGADGTINESLTLKKGYYRVMMSGGGGSAGYCGYHSVGANFYGKTASAGGGAAFYGIFYISADQSIDVAVGAVGAATSAFGVTCGAGVSATGCVSATGGAATAGGSPYVVINVNAGAGGSVSTGTANIISNVLLLSGNAGTTGSYADAAGGAGRLVYSGGATNYPTIDYSSYGVGSTGVYSGRTGATSSGATAGYLRIERCKYQE